VRPVSVPCDLRRPPEAWRLPAQPPPQGPSFSLPFLNFLFSLLTPPFNTAFLLLPLPPLHDLVLPVATMIHNRADHCITK